jgi:hypothetical protein
MKPSIFVLFIFLPCFAWGQIDLKRGIVRKRITNSDSIFIMGIETSSIILHAQRPYTRHKIKEKNKHRTIEIDRVTAIKLRQDSLEVAVILDYEKLPPRPQGVGFDTTFVFAISKIKSITLWLNARDPRSMDDPPMYALGFPIFSVVCVDEGIKSFERGETKLGITFFLVGFFAGWCGKYMIRQTINKKKYKIEPHKWHILPPKIRKKHKLAENKT